MLKFRNIILTIAACAVAGPAFADLPPVVYERARAEATEVVVIRVISVGALPDGADQGVCAVEGEVTAVERGDAHKPGQTLRLVVPCVGPGWTPRPGPFPGYDATALPMVRNARLWLKDDQLVLRGLEEVLPEPLIITP
ncbi:hypothetical protein [Brevundimonas sp. GCM10030266]|uniref:hypothetical protein n=1 Tax=Brevundimonas sp. GCM10030266 TaxID=3273386 RepID=UPI00360D3AF1